MSKDTAGQFDVVLVDNVLEHIHQPAPFLRQARRLLAPRGLMIVVIPPLDWLRRSLAAMPYVRERVEVPQINVFAEVDEHVNIMGRCAVAALMQQAGLQQMPVRFHHTRLFDNPMARAAGLDDGYYFASAR